MAKRKKGGRTTPKKTRPRHWDDRPRHLHAVPTEEPELFPIVCGFAGYLHDNHLAETRQGTRDFGGWAEAVRKAIPDEEMLDHVAHIAAELFDDNEMRRLAAAKASFPPGYVTPASFMKDAVVTECAEFSDEANENGSFVCGVRIPPGEEFSATVFFQRLGGINAIDAYPTDASASSVIEMARTADGILKRDTPSLEIKQMALDAIDQAKMTWPPITTDVWPSLTLVVEWIFGKIPGERPQSEWEPALDPTQQEAFIQGFLGSRFADEVQLSTERIRSALQTVMFFKLGYGNGDPELWGVDQTGYLLTDWVLRKVGGPDDDIIDIVATLPAFVRWSHERCGASNELTTSVLDAISDFSVYTFDQLDSAPDRLKGAAAIAAMARTIDADDFLDLDVTDLIGPIRDEELEAIELRRRQSMVGGPVELAALTAEPLPAGEQPGSLDRVPPVAQEKLLRVAHLSTETARTLYGDEVGTAMARYATHVCNRIPHALGKGRAESAAAALVFMIASANDVLRTLKEVQDALGIKTSPKDRARTFCKEMNIEFNEWTPLALGSPDFLTGWRRQAIIDGATW